MIAEFSPIQAPANSWKEDREWRFVDFFESILDNRFESIYNMRRFFFEREAFLEGCNDKER